MAEIRQELVLEDKFSRVLDDFMKRLENIEKVQDRLAEQATEQNKHSEEMNNKFDRLNNTALRLANNGLQQLQRRIIALGVSFIGFRALYSSFMGSVNDFDTNIRYNNRSTSSGDVIGYSRQLAKQFGGSASDYAQVQNEMAKFSNTEQSNRMESIGARLASITPGMSVAQGMGAVSSAMYNRSGAGLINQFGLNADRTQRHKLDILLQQGRLDEALDIIEQLSEQAGATEKSLNKMLNSPLVRLQRFQATIDDLRKTIGDELLNAFLPIMDAFNRLFKSEDFQKFVSFIGNAFKIIGQTVADVVNYIIDNWDRIAPAIKKVLPWLGVGLGLLITYKLLLFTLPALFGAVKVAMNLAAAAQWALNAAMSANPIGIVAAAIVGLIAGLTLLSGKFDKTTPVLGRFVGIIFALGAAVKNIFAGMYNAVGEPITQILNIFGTIINTILNLDKPLVALQVLFTNVFSGIANVILGAALNLVEFGKTAANVIKSISRGKLDFTGTFDNIGDRLYKAKDWVNENKQKNDEWAKSQGYNEFVPAGLQFSRMELTDYTAAYEKGTSLFKELADKFKFLSDSMGDNSDEVRKNTASMKNLGNIIDKDTWMDTMTFATSDAERKAVLNANKTYTDNSSTVINVTGDNTLELKEEIEKLWKQREEEYKRQFKSDGGDSYSN